MPTIIDDYKRIVDKIKMGKAETISESDGNYLSCCTKGKGHDEDYRNQPFSDVKAKQRAWELKPSYVTMLLNTYVFNTEEIESIIQKNTTLPFAKIIENRIAPYIGKSEDELYSEFNVNRKAKQGLSNVIRKIMGLTGDIDNTAEFKKANMNLRTIRIKYNGVPKEDNPFKCYEFKKIIETSWEDSQMKAEIVDKRFMYVFFRAKDQENKFFCLDKIIFWGFPDVLIDEAHRVWDETVQIINDGVKLDVDQNKVYTNFPTSKVNKVVFTKIHAKNTYYEIEKGRFVGKGSLSDTDELPDGRRITKHSFWFPKMFIKKIYDGDEDWTSLL